MNLKEFHPFFLVQGLKNLAVEAAVLVISRSRRAICLIVDRKTAVATPKLEPATANVLGVKFAVVKATLQGQIAKNRMGVSDVLGFAEREEESGLPKTLVVIYFL